MKDLNDILYNKPLYPETNFFENKAEEKSAQNKSPLSSIFGENSNLQNVLPLLLGMKSGSPMEMLSNILPKGVGDSPLFKAFSSFESNKKESTGSQKKFPKDEIF